MPLLQPPLPGTFITAAIASPGGAFGRVSVTGPLAFSMAPDLNDFWATVELVADGVHTPTFPGFNQRSGANSYAYNNTAGIINTIDLYFDPTESAPTYAVSAISPSAIPAVASITCPHTWNNSTITIATNGAPLNPNFMPSPGAFSTNQPQLAITWVSVSANEIQLTVSGLIRPTDVITLSYAGAWPGVAPYSIAAQDQYGNCLAPFTGAPVTVT